jgi:prepilin-type N-terminal cleavage/methylation domain-containing protein
MRPGYTLFELLAVITIIALVAGISAVGLVAGSEQAQLNGVISKLQDMDAYARLLAQSGQPNTMSLNRGNGTVKLQSIRNGESLGEYPLPNGWTASFNVQDRHVEEIDFDSQGRSFDYKITLTDPARSKSWQVCGLTGWIMESETSP